jgi:hypothetical protein
MIKRILTSLVCVGVSACILAAQGQPKFIKIHEGRHWTWVARSDQYENAKSDIEALYEYADTAFDKLCEVWGMQPKKTKFTLLVMDRPGGGFAAGDIGEAHDIPGAERSGIGCSYDAFSGTANGSKAYWAHILITHEMVNLFTGQIVSGGWPYNWWANTRSPFPYLTAVTIEYMLVPKMAVYHDMDGRKDPLLLMFMKLKDQYGWAMFRKMFKTAISDGINWDAFGENPSKLRTAYTAAYLQIGAPEDIIPILAKDVPDFDTQMVKDIVKAHKKWTTLPANSRIRMRLKAAFLKGDYATCLK